MRSEVERLTGPVRRGLRRSRRSPRVLISDTYTRRKYSGSLGCHEHANDNLQRSATRIVGSASTYAPPGHGAHRNVPAGVSHSLADADTSNLKATKCTACKSGALLWRASA